MLVATLKLADARAELRVSQEKLAKAANISKQTIVNAEKGMAIQRITAHALLKALNRYRDEKYMRPLSITDIDWRIVGE